MRDYGLRQVDRASRKAAKTQSGTLGSLLMLVVAIGVAMASGAREAVASEPASATATGAVDYETQIKPFLRERCFGCHGALRQEGSLRLDTVELMLSGGDSGPAIETGDDVDASLLLERVAETDLSVRMPPEHEGEAFTPAQIEMFRSWIAAGATGIEDEQPEKSPEEHWAFQPLTRPQLPQTTTAWARNPIDQWIHLGHQQQNLTPQPEASRSLLLRRLTLDLIGVLPTAAELDAFESDTDPDWYEKAVERLLEDPRHGERWARHWMDIWRYSDWWGLGDQLRNSQRHMWHWRDWMIQSLNDDRGYDEMVRLMLAADETHGDDPESLRATGYLARNFFIFNRSQWMDETVEHVGKSLLGLTFNCAKCHDHKFDPISHVDYYRLRAFFEPYEVRVDRVLGETNTFNNGIPRAFDAHLEVPTYRFERGEEALADKSRAILPGLPEILGAAVMDVQPIPLPEIAYQPQRHRWVIEADLAAAAKAVQQSEAKQTATAAELAAAEHLFTELQRDPQAAPMSAIQPFEEPFENFLPQHWAMDSGRWAIEQGRVKQSIDGSQEAALRYLGQVPVDFDASLSFRIHGGQTWKSVGIAFDVVDTDGKHNEQLVYASAVSGGAKVQASYKDQSQAHYPGNAAKAVGLELERDYVLRVQARGSLINVFLDDTRMVSWRSPLPRAAGDLRLIAFDAIASMDHFTLSPLEDSVELFDPASETMVSGDRLEMAQRQIDRARAADTAAQLQLAIDRAVVTEMQSRADAFRARWDQLPEAQQVQTHQAAIRAARELSRARANLSRQQAADKLAAADQEQRAAAEQVLQDAEKAFSDAQAACDADVDPSESLVEFSGATWTATRFLNTGVDDPTPAYPQISSGRRSALADWIASPTNPLTARVAVNHLWSRHLDQPLAATTFDMGRNVADPVNPELLDWLASELIDNGWSMKHIHRLIVNSATYRMSSSLVGAEQAMEIDPDNRYWWRRTPIRLESQAVRDSILALAGTLDPTIGGPSVPPEQQAESHRRSLYFFHSNNDRNLFLTTFDDALVTECYRREQSIVPQQALALTNGALVLDNAPLIAARLVDDTANDRQFVQAAFRLLLAIDASDAEIDVALAALQRWHTQIAQSQDNAAESTADAITQQARGHLVWALLNHNDFVTLR